jgi:hypothetical protein
LGEICPAAEGAASSQKEGACVGRSANTLGKLQQAVNGISKGVVSAQSQKIAVAYTEATEPNIEADEISVFLVIRVCSHACLTDRRCPCTAALEIVRYSVSDSLPFTMVFVLKMDFFIDYQLNISTFLTGYRFRSLLLQKVPSWSKET